MIGQLSNLRIKARGQSSIHLNGRGGCPSKIVAPQGIWAVPISKSATSKSKGPSSRDPLHVPARLPHLPLLQLQISSLQQANLLNSSVSHQCLACLGTRNQATAIAPGPRVAVNVVPTMGAPVGPHVAVAEASVIVLGRMVVARAVQMTAAYVGTVAAAAPHPHLAQAPAQALAHLPAEMPSGVHQLET